MATAKRLVVIITALQVERTAVLQHLRDVGEEPELRGSIYRRGIFDEPPEPWEVVVAEIGAGNQGAAAEVERVIAHYSPQIALFVGVAGAIKDLKHGDVVASTKVYAYESGKDERDGFKPRPTVQLPGYGLEQRTRYEAGEPDWRRRIKAAGHAGQDPAPVAKVGPIAAGEKVLASDRTQIYKFVRENYGDALAVEMEGHGFLLGVHMNHPAQGIVIRGISDCISDKNEASDKNWQPVAARHAAAFAFQVLAKLSSLERGTASGTLVTSDSVQKSSTGDVSGNNNVLTINQYQGPRPDDNSRLVQQSVDPPPQIGGKTCPRLQRSNRRLQWALGALILVLFVLGFSLFLYSIPPECDLKTMSTYLDALDKAERTDPAARSAFFAKNSDCKVKWEGYVVAFRRKGYFLSPKESKKERVFLLCKVGEFDASILPGEYIRFEGVVVGDLPGTGTLSVEEGCHVKRK